jgi:hypothetical protein
MLACPSTHQVQRAEGVPSGPPHGLPVDGDMLDVELLREGSDPILETVVECAGTDTIEDAFESVVRRDAVGEWDEAAKPSQAQFAKGLDLLPILGAAQDGTQGDDNDVEQLVSFVSVDAWVFELAKVVFDGKWGSQGNSSMKRDVTSRTNGRRVHLTKQRSPQEFRWSLRRRPCGRKSVH